MAHCAMNTDSDDQLANYMTPTHSPANSDQDVIEISSDDEATQEPILFIAERLSPQPKKKKKHTSRHYRLNEIWQLRQRELDGHLHILHTLYCNEVLSEHILDIDIPWVLI